MAVIDTPPSLTPPPPARHPLRVRSRRYQEHGTTRIELRVQIMHPMENGRRRDPTTGRLLAAHYIEWLEILCSGQRLAGIACGKSVARNPVFIFELDPPVSDHRITVRWRDNLGEQGQVEHTLT